MSTALLTSGYSRPLRGHIPGSACGRRCQMRTRIFRPSRRRALKGAAAIGGAAVLASALESTAQQKPKPGLKKRSKESVGYRDEPLEGRSCAKCVLYVGHGECVI